MEVQAPNPATARLEASDSRPAAASGRYLYAVLPADGAHLRYDGIGLKGTDVYAITADALAAVVSDVPDERLRPERRHLAAHQQVLKAIMKQLTPLPMSFGHIADGPEAIRDILRRNQDAFLDQLRRVDGKVEMGLRVAWSVPSIFEYFVAVHPRLRMLRDELFRGGREPSQDDKIELGRQFDLALNEDRMACTAKVIDVLTPCCFETATSPPRDEREVMNLACLVGRDAEADFERGVFEAAKLFDDNFAFDYSGPWPPYTFVSGDVQF